MKHSNTTTATRHFLDRQQRRGLRPEVRNFIYWYGTEFDAADAVHLTLLERALPPEVRSSPLVEEARDWILVLSRDGALLTCYRRTHATRFLRRKSEARYTSLRAA